MENLKIKVNDEAESKEVQELLSYLDYNGKPYLLTNKKKCEKMGVEMTMKLVSYLLS